MHTRLRKLWQLARPLLVPSVLTVLALLMLWQPMLWWFQGQENYDREAMQEWVTEATVFETLPQLVDSYLKLQPGAKGLWKPRSKRPQAIPKSSGRLSLELQNLTSLIMENKRREIGTHLKSLGEPATKIYPGRLVLFPLIYQMKVTFQNDSGPDDPGLDPITWDSALPHHEGQSRKQDVGAAP